MFMLAKSSKAAKILLVTILLFSTFTVGGLATYALQPANIPLEVKEPLEIIDYPSSLSLYRGETLTFDVTIQNSASATYFVMLDFSLNDTEYQAKYVTFSNHNYSVIPGTQKLAAWLTVATDAPPANLIITVTFAQDIQPEITPSLSNLTPSLQLLSGGARWASPEGRYALFVNNKDNWEEHHLTDGADWGQPWFSEEVMDRWRTTISNALEQTGFEVTFAGDVPEDLSGFDLVVFEALWAVEPKHASSVREYLSNGGGVVVLSGVPTQFVVYCKDRWPYRLGGTDLTSIHDWFGAKSFANTNGNVKLIVDKPFGTQLAIGETVYSGGGSEKAVTLLNDDARIVALWDSGLVFAFANEYGKGRVYYQGEYA